MTLILGLDCADGLLLASDGQITIGTTGRDLRGPGDKLFCSWTNIAWAGSGHVGIIQRVAQALESAFPCTHFEDTDIGTIREELCSTVAGVVRPLLAERHIAVPGSNPLTSYLFVGHVPQGSFILEVGAELLDTDHTATGYSAIGSGDIFPYFALVGLAHFKVRQHRLAEAKLVAYRVVDDAIRAAAMGLGPPIQMVEIRRPGAAGERAVAQKLSRDDLRILEDKVAEWKALEAETLGRFIGVATQAPQ